MLVPTTGLRSLEQKWEATHLHLPSSVNGGLLHSDFLTREWVYASSFFIVFSLVHIQCDVWTMLWCSYKAFAKWESLIWGFLSFWEIIHLFSIQNTQSLVKYCCWIKKTQMLPGRVFAVEWSNSLTLKRSIRSILKMARYNTNLSYSVIWAPAV